MKLLCLVVFISAAALVTSEFCTSASGCSHVQCQENSVVACLQLQCTCSTSHGCRTSSECHNTGDHCLLGWHCVDGSCHCGFGIGGIGK